MKKVLFFILIITACVSCKKTPPQQEPCVLREAPKDFLAYWYFPSESRWVYKLDTSVDIFDTLSNVSSLSEEIYGAPDGPGHCRYVYRSIIYHSNTAYFPHYDAPRQPLGYELLRADDDIKTNGWRLSQYSESAVIYPARSLFEYPFQPGSEIEGNKLQSIDSFSTPLGTFDSTLHITSFMEQNTLPGPSYKHFKEMHIAKNVGLIEIKYTNGEIWKLVDYEIK
jgi:hypothetical protein